MNTVIIYMSDDERPKCGLADRIHAIIWAYALCKKHGFDFKINFTHPFDLTEYLEPNHYDWTCNYHDMLDAQKAIKIANFNNPTKEWLAMYADMIFYETRDPNELEAVVLKHSQNYSRILLYSNMFEPKMIPVYGKLFHELFRVSNQLSEMLQTHINQMGERYVAVHLRFQLLLNDTNSEIVEIYKLPVLKPKEQKKLVSRCIKNINRIRKLNPSDTILICSDSKNFIHFINDINRIYFIDGERKHLDVKGIDKKQTDLMFLDYFLMASAKKIYSIIGKPMYYSGFPRSASYINMVPLIGFDLSLIRRMLRRILVILFGVDNISQLRKKIRKLLFGLPNAQV